MSIQVFQGMLGTTIEKIDRSDKELVFHSEEKSFRFYHWQDCCESVYIEDIAGDVSDLIGSPLIMAEEVSNRDYNGPVPENADNSYTWTFYRFGTRKGSITVRWFGTSNGYYSESVSFEEELRSWFLRSLNNLESID